MPRRSSGALNVARSLATQTSAIIATRSPPAWQIPFTAATTGARLSRIVRNGSISWARSGSGSSPSLDRPPRSPPAEKTSPSPVMIMAGRSGSRFTRCTARLMPKYMAGVKALRASGRSMMHQPMTPSRSNRSPAAPRLSVIALSLRSLRSDGQAERDADRIATGHLARHDRERFFERVEGERLTQELAGRDLAGVEQRHRLLDVEAGAGVDRDLVHGDPVGDEALHRTTVLHPGDDDVAAPPHHLHGERD